MGNETSKTVNQYPLSAFPDGFPCGIMYCTCEKYPRVLYANQWILEMLGMPSDDEYWNDFLRDNVFFLVPQQQWPDLRECLNRAIEEKIAVRLKHQVRVKEGTETNVSGWVRTITGENGENQLVFLYFSEPNEENDLLRGRENAYLAMLADAYDGVFRIERQNRIVECLSIKERLNTRLYFMGGMRIVLDCMLQKSYYALIYEDDRDKVETFFRGLVQNTGLDGEKNCRIEFRTAGNGVLREFILAASELDDQTVLLCCREVTEERSACRKAEELRKVQAINEQMESRGNNPGFQITAYRLLNGRVFSQTGDTPYLPDEGELLDEFLAQSHISSEQYQTALREGEAALTPQAGSDEREHLYIARKKAGDSAEAGELLLIYRFKTGPVPPTEETPRVTIHTFGYFDVLVDGKPIVFPHEKSKEMLALMVDRKGSFVGNPYFISCLWEDEPYSEKIQSRCRQTAFRMMETLKRYGIEDIIEKVDGHRRIVPEKVKCDYFDYINGKRESRNKFNGTYMSDYSWGEETLSTLLREAEYIKKRDS